MSDIRTEVDRLKSELASKDAELGEAKRQLASTKEQYINLYNLAPVGHLTVGANGVIRQSNDTALELFGATREELLGKAVSHYLASADREVYEAFREALFSHDDVQISEVRLRRPDGKEFYVELRGRRMVQDDAEKSLGFIVVANVSERREMHDALRRRNRQLAALNRFARSVSDSFEVVDVVAALALMLAESSDVAAGAIYVYEPLQKGLQLAKRWGATALPDEIIEAPIAGVQLDQLVTKQGPFYARRPADLPWLSGRDTMRLPDHQPSIFTLMAARGQVEGAIWLFDAQGQGISEERIAYFGTLAQQAGVAMRGARLFEDVRNSKERLKLLTREIVSAQEEERRRLSRELHDEAGQLLTALKLSLEMLDEDLHSDSEQDNALASGRRQLASAIMLSERAMAHIRGLVHNLRPTALDDLGLNSALEGLCHDFSQHSGLAVHYREDVDKALILSDPVQIVAYRFLQEALTNVSKHAEATEVGVLVQKIAGDLRLLVEDNGVGFDMHPAAEGLGILGMRERLESVGGRLEISSEPRGGTRLVAWIPVDS